MPTWQVQVEAELPAAEAVRARRMLVGPTIWLGSFQAPIVERVQNDGSTFSELHKFVAPIQ